MRVAAPVVAEVAAEAAPAAPQVTAAPQRLAPASPLRKVPAKPFQPPAVMPRAAAPAAVAVNASLPPASVAIEEPRIELASAPLPPPEPLTVTLKPGTLLQVRLGERLASDRNVAGDAFFATLDQPLVVDGFVIAERGARVMGRVADVVEAGRVQGTASIALELESLTASGGQKIALRTARFVRKGDTSKKADAARAGLGAAIGAAIGAAAGGGKGAAIGAAAGATAGTGVVLATRGKAAVLETETRLSFRLDEPVTITERR